MIQVKRRILTYAAVFFGLVLLFTTLMTLVFCIPEELLEWHVESSNYSFSVQFEWRTFFLFGTDAARVDNGDDRMMINHALKADPQMNALEAAMSINGYSRYWHGYLVWLRPLLVLYNLGQLRYFYMMVFFMLLCLTATSMAQRLKAGLPAAIALTIAVSACYLTVIPTCMQYAHVFLITFVACIVLLRYYERIRRHLPLVFMIVGMLTSFIDFLTAPLLTLGIPLLICLFIENHQTETFDWKSRIWMIFSCSALWAIGYVGCWACKWILSVLILDSSELDMAAEKISAWTSEMGAGSRWVAIEKNFRFYFLEHGIRAYLVFALPALILAAKIIRHRNKAWYKGLVYLPVGLFPYLWYLVVNGHSHFHPFFSHRIQAITAFSLMLFLIDLAQWNGKNAQQITLEKP